MSERIADRCPSCNGRAIFVGEGGWLTCSHIDCPEPVIGSAIKKLEAENERLLKRVERLSWTIRMVLQDFEYNNSPHLSVAAVKAVQSVEALVQEEES